MEKPVSSSTSDRHVEWSAHDQCLLAATLTATPAQRLAWLEEALHLAYEIGGLKPRRFISKKEWEAMGSLPR